MKFDWLLTRKPLRGPSDAATHILALTCSEHERRVLSEIASENHWRLCLVSDLPEALERLREQSIGVILCDRDFGEEDWRHHLAHLRQCAPDSCVLLLSGVNDDYLWEEVIRNGGYDVLTKPLRAAQVVPAVTLAWSYWLQSSARK